MLRSETGDREIPGSPLRREGPAAMEQRRGADAVRGVGLRGRDRDLDRGTPLASVRRVHRVSGRMRARGVLVARERLGRRVAEPYGECPEQHRHNRRHVDEEHPLLIGQRLARVAAPWTTAVGASAHLGSRAATTGPHHRSHRTVGVHSGVRRSSCWQPFLLMEAR
jgi:hypothetical protein